MGNNRYKEFPEYSENECTAYSNLWNTVKGGLVGKFIALAANI